MEGRNNVKIDGMKQRYEKGREEGRKPWRRGGRELLTNLDLFHERAVLHSESMFALSFWRAC